MPDRRFCASLSLALLAATAAWAAAKPPIVSPDVPLEFDTGGAVGPGQRVVYSSAKWTILLECYNEILTDTEGPHIRRLFRRPAAGGELVLLWDGSRPGGDKGGAGEAPPHVWIAYDDGAVLFSRGSEMDYVAQPGACKAWHLKVGDEDCLPAYVDPSGMLLRPADFSRPRDAWFAPGERDAFDLEHRVKLTGDPGIRFPEPLVKRNGSRFVWLDWPSFDDPASTTYRLGCYDLDSGKGWTREVQIKGKPVFEHFVGAVVQVSGQKYDAATGSPR